MNRTRLVTIQDKLDIAATALMVFSFFGYLGNVMLDYNWGTNFLTNSFAVIYSFTLGQAIPVPIGYYGAGAIVYFGLFLLSFLVLNRREPHRKNVFETLRLGAFIVVVFELGLYLFVPYFMDKWVIDAFRSTPLQSFTNIDLLVTGVGLLLVSQVLLWRVSIHKRQDAREVKRTV